MRRVKQSQDRNIVLCCSIESLPEILKQAQQVGLMTDQHQFIITSLDMHTIDLEPFQYSGTNITGFRIVSPDDPMVKQVTDVFRELHFRNVPAKEISEEMVEEPSEEGDQDQFRDEMPPGLTAEKLQLQTALTYDAIMLFAHIMSQHRGIRSDGILCDDSESTFVNGTSIFNSMKTIPPIRGLTGDLQFDQHGNRENFQLDVLELASEGLKKVGTWNATKGIQSSRGKTFDQGSTDPDILRNKTLIVLTVIVSVPFLRTFTI